MTSLQRLSWFIAGVGVIGVVRLIPELLLIPGGGRVYVFLVSVDFVLALMMIAAAWALRREKPWAPRVTLHTVGVLVANSVGWGFLLAPYVAKGLTRSRVNAEYINLLPRLLYYMIVVFFTPYASRVLFRSAFPEVRPSLWASLGGAMAVGGLLFGVAFISR